MTLCIACEAPLIKLIVDIYLSSPEPLSPKLMNSQSEIAGRRGPQLSVRGIIFMDAKSEICFR